MAIFDRLKKQRDDETITKVRERVKRGRSYQHALLMREAFQEFQEALKLDPNCADAYYGLGRCYHHFAREENERAGGGIYFRTGLENLDQAIDSFWEVVRLDPLAPDGYLNLGLACDNRSRLKEAEWAYREVIRLDSGGMDGADAHFDLSLLLYMRALGWAGLKTIPGFTGITVDDSMLEVAFAMAERGIAIGEQIIKSDPSYIPNLIQGYRRLGDWYDTHLKLEHAIKQYQAIIRLTPADQKALARLAQSDDELKARIFLRRGVALKKTFDQASTAVNVPLLLKAIQCFSDALLTFSNEWDFPMEWATAQANLARAYSDLPTGDVVDNLKRAINHYRNASRVINERDFTEQWAVLQNNLGIAYKDLPIGDRKENLEKAVTCYYEVLRIVTEQDFPYVWAMTQGNLGHACWLLPTGNKSDNLYTGITHYRAALQVFTEQEYPMDWAKTQVGLATIYTDLPTGNRVENLNSAMTCCQSALRILTPQNSPQEWAVAQNNLGNAYAYLQIGDRVENLRLAIAYHLAPLQVYTEQAFPDSWANTQYNLGVCYINLPTGNKAANIKEAIAYFQAALRVYTEQDFPVYWARTQNSLATSYARLPMGNHRDNLNQAVDCYRAALRVYTEQDFPKEWAQVQHNIGSSYLYSPTDKQTLQEAITCLQAALRVRTEHGFPMEWAETINSLGRAYEELSVDGTESALGEAIKCYRAVSHVWTSDTVPFYHIISLYNLSRLLFRERRWQEAFETIQEGIRVLENVRTSALTAVERIRVLTEYSDFFKWAVICCIESGLLNHALVYAERGKTRNLVEILTRLDVKPQGVEEAGWRAYLDRLAEAQHLERQVSSSSLHDTTAAKRYRSTREDLARVRNEIEQFEGRFRAADPDYLPTASPLSFDDIREVVRQANAVLVEFRVTDAGTFAFLLGGDDAGVSERQVVRVPEFTDDVLGELLVKREEGEAAGGWLVKYYRWRRAEISRQEWLDCMWRVTGELYARLLCPVHERLRELYPGAQRLLLVPNKGLNLLPLHAAHYEAGGQRRYWLDDYEVFYAPSCAVLRRCLEREAGRGEREALFAVQNPSGDLPFADWDVEEAAGHFRIKHILRGSEATIGQVKRLVTEGHEVLLSCHGTYNLNDVYESQFLLRGDDRLRLGDILQLDLSGAWLVVLSACETAVSDFRDVVDEVQGLHTAFLIARAPTVVGSLWSVSDLSTALLMKRFHENLYERCLGKAGALREAQQWVRDMPLSEVRRLINEKRQELKQAGAGERLALIDLARARFDLEAAAAAHGGKPLAHPYWWAAFQCVGAG